MTKAVTLLAWVASLVMVGVTAMDGGGGVKGGGGDRAEVVQCGGKDEVLVQVCCGASTRCLGSLKRDFLCMNVNVCKCYMHVKIVSPFSTDLIPPSRMKLR